MAEKTALPGPHVMFLDNSISISDFAYSIESFDQMKWIDTCKASG
jgi:hypothetical protein